MKNVFKTNEIAHIWANQLQESARNSANNLFFEGATIYSYGRHFEIAKHVTNEKGDKAILFNKNKYSNTTAKHIQLVRNGSSHLTKIYVPDVANNKYFNFESWVRECEAIAKNLLKAKKPEIYLNQISVIANEVKEYTNFFGYDIPQPLQDVLNITNKEEYTNYQNSALERAKKENEEQVKKAKKDSLKQIKEFKDGKRSTVWNRLGKDYLRYNETSKRVETSQGIEIPVIIAERFYKQILKINSKGGCTDCEAKLMEYNVKEINKSYIVIGCHNVDIKEISKIALQLKW